ncbi:gamma-tocopherol methyltransferase, chloroplastic-like isoform X1 [Coffea arabica]|uniref:Gamma-tocopherol methyltransferase, chloroplastic-like isoform X1 n=1 Tax=Coffea arabica TaxID=13443 RepID=A0A6P6VIF2_COFAR|nr:probable tocopherol O-methyltransferase, chloroplastic isoform X1 [Coffea arabica]XP_027102280.1 probable tocopherol O-methyltransferase, chloroplastic isoform X1 [Coffea arabica]
MEGEKMDTEGKVETEKMNKAIAMAYDVQSKIVEDLTGDHFHVGFYDSSSVIPGSDVHSAQTRMIEAGLRFASVSEDPSKKPRNILDVGCGIGGSTRYLASKYGSQCKGITLSPVEAERARVLTSAQGLESQQVSFEVADALNQPFADGSFDLIWCIECADHISDKTKFVHELNRVAAPGATIILLTWCHRDLSPLEQDLHPDEKKLLSQLESSIRIKWISAADYINLFKSCSLEEIKYADWSPHVAPYYAEMRKITLSWKGIMAYVRHAGWRQLSIRALMMPSVFEKFKTGLFKYCILTCQKPQ